MSSIENLESAIKYNTSTVNWEIFNGNKFSRLAESTVNSVSVKFINYSK